jgi:hypothetical protein
LQSKIILSFDSKRNKMQSNWQSLQYFIALGLAMTKLGCLKTFLDRREAGCSRHQISQQQMLGDI